MTCGLLSILLLTAVLQNTYNKHTLLSRSQTIDNAGQLLWAWFSFLRKSADEIFEPCHTSLLTSWQWRQKMADDKYAHVPMLLAMLTAKQHKKWTVWVRRWLLICWSCICFKVNCRVSVFRRVTAHINCVDPISQVCRGNRQYRLLTNHSSAF